MKAFVIIFLGALYMMGCRANFSMKNLSSAQPTGGLYCLDEETLCLQGTTCCPTACGSYYCCPHFAGICCPDNRRCCPSGTHCNPKNLTCDPLGMEDLPNYH